MPATPVYVETFVEGPLEALWEKTQEPQLHQQWDLRFSEITYLPKQQEEEHQRFIYSTRIGFGIKVAGTGESVATKIRDGGESTSVLKFMSDSPLSLIREGSGYWKYKPEGKGVRFITGYTYTPRYGLLGRLADKVFRPLIGWATAWSFDCLRLWIERGTSPASMLRLALIQFASKSVLGLCWFYQGLVPKILFPDAGERAILEGSGFFSGATATAILYALGLAEMVFGLLFLLLPGNRAFFRANVLALTALGLGGLAGTPAIFVAPFNPFSLSLAMAALSFAGLQSLEGIPYAWRCKRKP